jgi:hypothetical protein
VDGSVHDGPALGSSVLGLVRLVPHMATRLIYTVKLFRFDHYYWAESTKRDCHQLEYPNIVRIREAYESSHSRIHLVQESIYIQFEGVETISSLASNIDCTIQLLADRSLLCMHFCIKEDRADLV